MNYKKGLTPEFKAKVALEVLQESQAEAEIAWKYEISLSAVTKLKEDLLTTASQVFEPKKDGIRIFIVYYNVGCSYQGIGNQLPVIRYAVWLFACGSLRDIVSNIVIKMCNKQY